MLCLLLLERQIYFFLDFAFFLVPFFFLVAFFLPAFFLPAFFLVAFFFGFFLAFFFGFFLAFFFFGFFFFTTFFFFFFGAALTLTTLYLPPFLVKVPLATPLLRAALMKRQVDFSAPRAFLMAWRDDPPRFLRVAIAPATLIAY